MCEALEEEVIVCPTKIAVGTFSARVGLAAYAAVVWVICGLATLRSIPDRCAEQSKDADDCSCALRVLRKKAYCTLKGLQCGLEHYESGESEFKSGFLLGLQGRS